MRQSRNDSVEPPIGNIRRFTARQISVLNLQAGKIIERIWPIGIRHQIECNRRRDSSIEPIHGRLAGTLLIGVAQIFGAGYRSNVAPRFILSTKIQDNRGVQNHNGLWRDGVSRRAGGENGLCSDDRPEIGGIIGPARKNKIQFTARRRHVLLAQFRRANLHALVSSQHEFAVAWAE